MLGMSQKVSEAVVAKRVTQPNFYYFSSELNLILLEIKTFIRVYNYTKKYNEQ